LGFFFAPKAETAFTGITFNYPENMVKGMKWFECGSYHVWKNRLKGQQLTVWQKN
jgi:hypothetical protein